MDRLLKWKWKPLVELCTAYHEAGHAVAALVLGLSVKKLIIKRDGDTISGLCTIPYTIGGGQEKQHIVCSLAGPAAENVLLGVDEPHLYSKDHRNAAGMFKFKFVRKSATESDLAPYKRAARRLVHKYEDMIVDVAAMLLVHGEVDCSTVTRMVAKRRRKAGSNYSISKRAK